MIAPAASAVVPGPLHVALVTETFPPEINGVAMTLRRLVEGMSSRGHRMDVIRPRQPGDPAGDAMETDGFQEILRPGFPIPTYRHLRFGLPSQAALERRWTADLPDLVHIATEGPLGLSALNVAERLHLPVSSSFHTNFHDYSRLYGCGFLRGPVVGYLRRFHNRTKVTMVPSDDLATRLAAEGFRNLATMARGVDTTLFDPAHRDQDLRRSWGAEPNDVVMLHVGRVAQEKNIPLALRAWQAAVRRCRELGQRPPLLVAVGDGPLRESLARTHPDARFTGALPTADLSRHYASADIFLFPSMSETFGNVLLEAMASGLAAIGFRYAAAERHAIHQENALIVPYGDEAAFIAQAVRAAVDADLRHRLGATARTVAEGIGWSAVIDRFESLVRGAASAQLQPAGAAA